MPTAQEILSLYLYEQKPHAMEVIFMRYVEK